jgi:hypothetical protein
MRVTARPAATALAQTPPHRGVRARQDAAIRAAGERSRTTVWVYGASDASWKKLTSRQRVLRCLLNGHKRWSLYGAPWLQPVAISGKSAGPRKPQKQAKSVATGCHRLPETFHGKQGVCRGLPPAAGGPLPVKEGSTSYSARRCAAISCCNPGTGIDRSRNRCMPRGSCGQCIGRTRPGSWKSRRAFAS